MRDRHTRNRSSPYRGRVSALGLSLLVLASLFVATLVSGREVVSRESEPEESTQNYSRFPHNTAQHTRLPCLVCHVRSDNSVTPRMPGHIPCASCHAEPFAAGNEHPICTICHTPTSVKRFPPLRSFNAVFDHGRHARQTGCATCHKPSNRGVALSIPARTAAHATCFQCHGPRTMVGGKNIGSCSTCHKPGRLTRTPESSRSFAINFSHAQHSRQGLNCASCHTIRPGTRRGAQVSSPLTAMHFVKSGVRSCASCHNDRRAFGDDKFASCDRCHGQRTFKF
jgi:c(7)-type cytochrome triheme protein